MDFKPIKYSLFNFLRFQNVTAQNLCEIRMLMEPGAAEIVATRKKNKGLETIRHLLEKTQKWFDAEKSIRELNVEFHLALARLSGNPLLILTLDFVLDLLKQSNIILRPDRLAEFSRNNLHAHWEIFEAIKKSDPEKAKTRMASHLREVQKILKPLEDKLKVKF